VATNPPPAPGTAPPAKRGGGCLRGCLVGCLLPLLVVVLVVGGGFYFLAGRAEASVSVPAELLVVHNATTLAHGGAGAAAAKSGDLVKENDTVATDAAGLASIHFQDGSITRIAANTSVQLTSDQFDKQGKLAGASMKQSSGRTYSTVQRLINGAKFTVQGHNAAAQVRGTRFEVVILPDGSTVLKVFEGTVHMTGKNDVTVGPGQQVTAAPDGTVGKPGPIQPDPGDPFIPWFTSENAAKAAGDPGSADTSAGTLATGGEADEPDYVGGGGDVIATLSYPGSHFRVRVTDPAGQVHEADTAVGAPTGGRLVTLIIPNGALGVYKVHVSALQTDNNQREAYAVTLVTKFVCAATSTDTGTAVRAVLSANDVRNALSQSGGSNVSVSFTGNGENGAVIAGSGNFSGTSVSGSAVLYASGGQLGAILTNITINGINLTQQVTEQIASATGHNLEGLDVGYNLQRVYTCSANNDTYLVFEGTH
jgi:hypothetical protein